MAPTEGGISGQAFGWRNWANLVAYALNLVITYVSLTGVFGTTNTDLSKKYQTLVTPAGFAFSIWGPIFIWEGVFAVAQMFPRYRSAAVVNAVTPWWLAACFSQICWTIAFAQEVIPLSVVFMFCILLSLLGLAWRTDSLKMTRGEFFVLRAPFSLHLGWILAASLVNASVLADSEAASPQALLALAVTSYAVIGVFIALFATAPKSPNPIECFVVAWAFNGIRAGLSDPQDLNSQDRYNPFTWDPLILEGLGDAAFGVAMLALAGAVFATARMVLMPPWRRGEMECRGMAAP